MNYKSLCTEFYDLTKPMPGALEWAFYDALLKNTKGLSLEAMCGSGRLLIPLLENGYCVEGVDNSPDMLNRCREKGLARSLSVTLYQQSLQELRLPKRYSLIFIPLGSFQHIREINESLIILDKLRLHLEPNGILMLETFGKQTLTLENPDKPLAFRWTATSSKGYEIVNKSIIKNVTPELLLNQMKYEKWENGELKESETGEWYIKSYEQEELCSLLHEAGFTSVKSERQSFESNPNAILYFASCSRN